VPVRRLTLLLIGLSLAWIALGLIDVAAELQAAINSAGF
jgi:hypothetical protein